MTNISSINFITSISQGEPETVFSDYFESLFSIKWKDNFGYFENVDFNPFVLCDQFYQLDYFDILISYREPETVINILMWFLLITLINLYTIISFNHYEKYDNFDHIDLNYLFLFHQFYLNHLDLSNHLDYFAYLDLVNQHFNVSMFDHFNWFKN